MKESGYAISSASRIFFLFFQHDLSPRLTSTIQHNGISSFPYYFRFFFIHFRRTNHRVRQLEIALEKSIKSGKLSESFEYFISFFRKEIILFNFRFSESASKEVSVSWRSSSIMQVFSQLHKVFIS